MRRKTKEEFLKELIDKNVRYKNGEFEVVGEYISNLTPIECICKIHGAWNTSTPASLLKNCGCSKCSGVAKKTHDEFLVELAEKNQHYRNGEFEVIGNYIDGKTPIECKCELHGNWYSAPLNLIRQNSGCAICSGKAKKNITSFIEELKKKNTHYRNNEFEIIGEYITNKTPIACKCPVHGIWNTSAPVNLLRQNSTCPRCSGSGKIENNIQFIQIVKKRNEHYQKGEFEILDEFSGANNKIKCRCPIHGVWNTTTASHLMYRNASCPKCKSNHQKTDEEFLDSLILSNEHYKNGEFIVINKYTPGMKKIICRCPIHGDWSTSPSSLKIGSGCPKCSAAGTSFPENYIRSALQQAFPEGDIPDKGDRTLLKGKEIDIPVYSYKFAVEYGSWYWHKDKWREDKRKQERLAELGIKLYTIYDAYNQEVCFPADFNVYTFSYNLGEEKNWITLRSIVEKLICDVKHSDIDWEKVEQKALYLSKTKYTERFVEELMEKNEAFRNGEFEISGSYLGARIPIECNCKIHGVWNTSTPDKLLQGRICPKCSRIKQNVAQTYDTETFVEILTLKNEKFARGEYEVVGDYVDSRTPIACKCMKHGVWETSVPTSLLQNHGCPRCAKETNSQIQVKYTTESFLQKLREKNEKYMNGEFEIIGEYEKYQTPIECKCSIHGIWKTSTPANLLRRNQGCPKCNKRIKRDSQ